MNDSDKAAHTQGTVNFVAYMLHCRKYLCGKKCDLYVELLRKLRDILDSRNGINVRDVVKFYLHALLKKNQNGSHHVFSISGKVPSRMNSNVFVATRGL